MHMRGTLRKVFIWICMSEQLGIRVFTYDIQQFFLSRNLHAKASAVNYDISLSVTR